MPFNTESRTKIGILGGTFNPVHLGHLLLAQSALETLELTKIVFVPCATPAHKDSTRLLEARHRLAMLQAAVEADLGFEVSDVEIQRGGVSYAIDTVRYFRECHPTAELFFIVGSDTLPELHFWKDIYSLLKLCAFAAFARPGFDVRTATADQLRLDPPWPERLLSHAFSTRQVDISSSDIRYRLAEGMSIHYLVPAAVEMYIAEHGLYGNRRSAGMGD